MRCCSIAAFCFGVLSTGTSQAADTQVVNGYGGVFERPAHTERHPVPRRPADLPQNAAPSITCLQYASMTVKELDYEGKGDAIVSIAPRRGSVPSPPCGTQDDPGERVISKEGRYFEGARGRFVQLHPSDGYGFFIFDSATGRQIFSDGNYGLAPTRFDVIGDVLTLSYARVVEARCSLLAEGAACWRQTARDAHLPAEIAQQPPPLAACAENYKRESQGSSPDQMRADPSVVTYDVTLNLTAEGRSTVLSRGALGCHPQS